MRWLSETCLKGEKMKKSTLALALSTIWFLSWPIPSQAQKSYRVSALIVDDVFVRGFEGFKTKMAELGYVEEKNVKYDLVNTKGNRDALPAMAERLVRNKPDLVVASSATAVEALAKVTKGTDIPVIFLSVADPLHFAKSYAGSGNNFAGISTSTIDLTEKRIELLKELVPGIKRAISLHHIRGLHYQANLDATRKAAKRLAVNLVEVNVASSDELLRRAPVLLTRKLGEAIIFPPDRIVDATQKQIFPQIVIEKMPSVVSRISYVEHGALATYAADYYALGQQGAVMADKILNGSRSANLPIEQPSKLKLVINLKTARAIGLKIPREILLRTDEVIE
jgi:putative ABC transport system substrate-binding protein